MATKKCDIYGCPHQKNIKYKKDLLFFSLPADRKQHSKWLNNTFGDIGVNSTTCHTVCEIHANPEFVRIARARAGYTKRCKSEFVYQDNSEDSEDDDDTEPEKSDVTEIEIDTDSKIDIKEEFDSKAEDESTASGSLLAKRKKKQIKSAKTRTITLQSGKKGNARKQTLKIVPRPDIKLVRKLSKTNKAEIKSDEISSKTTKVIIKSDPDDFEVEECNIADNLMIKEEPEDDTELLQSSGAVETTCIEIDNILSDKLSQMKKEQT